MVKVVQADAIRAAFMARQKEWRLEAWGQIGIGLALTVLVPMFFSGLSMLGGRRGLGLSFGMIEWVLGTVGFGLFMVIAYGVEWWYHGSQLMQRLWEIGKNDPWRDTLNDRWWKYEKREAAVWMELWLWVPRMAFEGWGKLRAMRMVSGVEMERVMTVTNEMLERSSQMAVADLRDQYGSKGDILGFERAMAYLVFYEWVAVSEDGARAWVGTISREALGPQS